MNGSSSDGKEIKDVFWRPDLCQMGWACKRTLIVNGNRGSKSKFGVWINMSLLAAEILVNMTLNHVKNKQTSQKVLYDE